MNSNVVAIEDLAGLSGIYGTVMICQGFPKFRLGGRQNQSLDSGRLQGRYVNLGESGRFVHKQILYGAETAASHQQPTFLATEVMSTLVLKRASEWYRTVYTTS